MSKYDEFKEVAQEAHTIHICANIDNANMEKFYLLATPAIILDLIEINENLLDALQEAKHMFAGEYPGHPTTERIFEAIEKATGAPA